MSVTLPTVEFNASGDARGRWWSKQSDGRILCELCPRACRLKPGDRGFCFVRANRDGEMVLDTYGKSTGFCIDPIEKKPLNHFLPGTPVLSFGTAGCNLGCKFCQNWDISKSREVARLSDAATPEGIAAAAQQSGCRSVAFTYNDPVIWAEYAIDAAAACHAIGLKSVAVTAGYITPQARGEFFAAMDAANIDLKSFSEEFYHRVTGSHLQPVLDTIKYVCNETDCWVELTNLVITDANDGHDELRQMCDWILDAVGADVPVHFTAFHPDFRMMDRDPTSHDTLIAAYDLARQTGLRYVYVGNVHDVHRQSTFCPSCGQLLIERDWHELGRYELEDNRCRHCQYQIAGVFEAQPGSWGRRRQPIRINHPRTAESTKDSTMPAATSTDVSEESYSAADRSAIHAAASQFVDAAVHDRAIDASAVLGELAQRPVSGVYVTLKRGETLRGCCGLQGNPMRLCDALAHSAQRTAKHDPRMPPIDEAELPFLDLTVSILGSPRPIGVEGDQRIAAVKVGRHGLRIQMGNNAGLLLPSVARERNWNSRQFLDAVCRKAGLAPGVWRSAEADLQIFDGIDFGGPLSGISDQSEAETAFIDEAELAKLTEWVRVNLHAIHTGATPAYYAPGLIDTSVLGVVLQIEYDSNQPPLSWLQLVLRDGVPLQSTLFQLTQAAAASLAAQGPTENWQTRVAILSSAIQHGVDDDADLRGVDCRQRAIVVRDARRVALAFDRDAPPGDLLKQALAMESFRRGAFQVYSLICDCSHTQLAVSLGPQAEPHVSARPPGVAGSFYPADDVAREQQIDELLDDLAEVPKQQVAAAMVPHAGLRFSGRIAADVWRRIELPETVLIIGPKHTADGVDWAVAPHDYWNLSATAGLPGDSDLAKQLAGAVPGLQLDAAAHRREHGIEVQLPILYRVSPHTRVVAIAMSGGGLAELQVAAKALANWLRGLEKPPLLVISSDMNHFADDQENRRRDALALAMLQKNDPAGLLQVCEAESISMCGQLPAALVLLTLRELGQDVNYEEIAYGTSADVSGDTSRVVGYAGVLF